ncbi:MAG: type IV pilus assembly protein PilF [Polaribacter sp.]|jgi:type IV pilus assembly protein PilF|tara:strand:- start:5346 stop:6140 length:795 start_codon:yes stop_codon:yes gene_type:complete
MMMKMTLRKSRLVVAVAVVFILSGCASTGSTTASASGNNQTAYQQHVNLAKQYIGLNKRDLARLHLNKAEQLHTKSDIKELSQLYNGYALLYQIELETDLTETYFLKALDSDPSDSVARYNFAAFLFNQERFAESLEQITRVSKDLNYPRRPQAFYIAGLAQKKLEDSVAAVHSFERAIELSPRFNLAYLEVAKAYFEQQRYLLARDAVGYYIALSGDTAESLWLLARIEFKMGNAQAVSTSGDRLNTLFADSEEAGRYRALVQ